MGTRSGTGLGTFLYAAPETLKDAARSDQRADVYGLAMCVVFVLHGGDLPYDVLHRREAFLQNPPTTRAVRRVLREALADDPVRRTRTVAVFRTALTEAWSEPGWIDGLPPRLWALSERLAVGPFSVAPDEVTADMTMLLELQP